MRRNAGFTLIELVTTMSVVAILAGVAAPSFAGLLERQRASAAMNSLMTHMALARMSAITRNRRAVLCPSTDGHHCETSTDWSAGWMLFADNDGNRKPDANEDIIRVVAEPRECRASDHPCRVPRATRRAE